MLVSQVQHPVNHNISRQLFQKICGS